MAILLTGGAGRTSIRIARLLQEAKIPFLIASRRGQSAAPSGISAATFDWLDPATYPNPFEHAPGEEKEKREPISAVYLVAPEVADPVPSVNAFLDYAVTQHAVKRFVLLADSFTEAGGNHLGKVWQHLLDLGVDYCVLRPTWFMENYSEAEYRSSITSESKIYSAFGDGKIPFVSATDIAAVAFRALTDPEPHNTDHRVLGPELLTHDQIAAKLSKSLGREIANVRLTKEQRVQKYQSIGLPEHLAEFVTSLELASADGLEERTNDVVERVTGRPATPFDVFVEENKALWQ